MTTPEENHHESVIKKKSPMILTLKIIAKKNYCIIFVNMKRLFAICMGFFLWSCLPVISQEISLQEVVEFYKNADIDCYKDKIQHGMESFDCWLRDTFPQMTNFESLCSPSDINLKEHEAIHLVRLCFYNMSNFNDTSSIYNHIIIDSLYCVMLAPVDKKGKPIGLTDVENTPYSYVNFKHTKNVTINSYQKGLNSLLKLSRRNHAEALVYLSYASGLMRFGYIANNKIYLCSRFNSQSFELDSSFKQSVLNTKYGIFHSDKIPVSEYEYWNKIRKDDSSFFTGHTPPEKIRLCK
jgi:hypothetical protein